jgi:ABC-type multidrug transport system ATPase subunit
MQDPLSNIAQNRGSAPASQILGILRKRKWLILAVSLCAAIATGLVVSKQPRVYEATASIDTETELLIQDALRKLTAGRTSILIAHRLQTIQEADRVLVLHHGRVEELGTHEELLARRGLYYTLHTLQFQAVTDDEIDEVIQHEADGQPG